MFLTIYKCTSHSDIITICIDDEHGIGTRFFTSKCCPNQYKSVIKKVNLLQERRRGEIEEFRDRLEFALDELDELGE